MGGASGVLVGGARSVLVGGASSVLVGGARSILVGGADHVIVGGASSVLSLVSCSVCKEVGCMFHLCLLHICTTCRAILSQTYEFTLQHVGLDPRSTSIWQEYLHFLKEG